MQKRNSVHVIVFIGIILAMPLSAVFTHSAHAISTEQTTLYFVPYDPLEFDDTDDFGNALMTTSMPTTANDSEWPPSLFVREQFLPTVNSEHWLTWFELWMMYTFMKAFPSDFEELDGFSEFEQFFDFFNPYKIQQSYIYIGDEPGEINGKIVFDLFFSSHSKLLDHDQARISISKFAFLFPSEIKNETISIKPTLIPGRIKPYTVAFDFIEEPISIRPGETLIFSVELIQSERTISTLLTKLHERGFEERAKQNLERFAEFLSNRRNEEIVHFGELLSEFLLLSEMFTEEGMNLTIADFGDLANSIRGSSFVFGSNTHPSKVTIPLILPLAEQENRINYYLRSDQTMDSVLPTGEDAARNDLSEEPLVWSSAPFSRSRILKSAEATVHFDYRSLIPLRRITLKAALLDNGDEIASSLLTLERTTLIDLIQKKQTIHTFYFPDIEYEVWFDHQLQFSLSLVNETRLGLRKLVVLCDSRNTPSVVKTIFEETTNIQMTWSADPSNEKIVPGGSIKYTINVSSVYDDIIRTQIVIQKKDGEWATTILPETVSISPNGYQIVILYVNSTDTYKKAYGNYIDFLVEVSGKTGRDIKTSSGQVSTQAIRYKTELNLEKTEFTVKRGENHSFSFRVKNNNTGAVDDTDSYQIQISSEQGITLSYVPVVPTVYVGREKPGEVMFFISKNATFTSDKLTITATSTANPAAVAIINVTIQVKGDSFFEMVYNFFASAAEALGFYSVFGSELAPLVLVALLLVLIFFCIIIIALLLTTKYVAVVCDQRIQEIDAFGEAQFEFIVQNLRKKSCVCELATKQLRAPTAWETSFDQSVVKLGSKQQQTVLLTVKPMSQLPADDWTELTVSVRPRGKRKSIELGLMVMITKAKPELKITEVFHWPKTFTAGEKIVTSFKIENKSPRTARNVSVSLSLNGKEKNKVGDLVIPGRGYADVQIPWIAVKGKNKVSIRLNEQ